jgi:tetratricopeptide (TPR) repeat protein
MTTMLLGALAAATLAVPHAADSVPLYTDLGQHSYSITTDDPMAQRYFDQGLRLYYAFNHEEAIASFREAARRDPACAMCFWGEALALGPNINMPMDLEGGRRAFAAIQEARTHGARARPVEQALIRATALRYGPDPEAERAALDSAFAAAMKEVALTYPRDMEAAALHAEAMMVLRPWNYWTRDGRPQPGTLEVLRELEWVIDANPDHPGACHFFIHAVEEVMPERAVACAERLATLMPGAGHLVHMPGHIYIRVGRYMDAIRANEHAVHADETFIRDRQPGPGVYTVGYYPHNYDFMAFAAAMAGRRAQAIRAAESMAGLIPDEMLRVPGMSFLQNHVSRAFQIRARFGEWNEILASAGPAEDLLYARGIWHYARGRALASLGQGGEAADELAALRAVLGNGGLDEVGLEFNDAGNVLRIAEFVLEGVLAGDDGRFADAARSLRKAVDLEDALVYGEPPEWSVPVRHDLGAVLLAGGDPAGAEAVYREDLARFPENGWSLWGLSQALRAQRRDAEADEVDVRFREAWRYADIELFASMY